MPACNNLRRRLWAASCHPAFVLASVAAVLPGCQPEAVPTADSTATIAEVDTCGGPATAIASLPRRSGSGIAEMGRITVEGVVVGVFQAGLNGYFLQSGIGEDDGNERTPEGVFVELSETVAAPKVGERLRVAGKWSRSDDRAASTWALREVDQVQRCDDSTLPPVVELSAPPADWASLSGMRVRIPGPAVLSGNESLLRYGEATIAFGDTRLYAATEQKRPGPSARQAEQDNRQRSLLLDDGRGGEYARNLWWLPQPVSAQAPYRAGSLLHGLEGVIDHRHGRWRLQLLRPAASVQQAPRPEPPARAEGSVRVASFNVLNFFNGDGSGGGFPTERGAASPDLQQRQRSKLVAAMRQLDADVIALMEVENDGFGADSAVAELAAALAGPARRGSASIPWQAVRPDGLDQVGRDVITVGLVYRADRVEPVGPARTLAVAPFDDHSRMPLAQTFRPLAGSSEARPFVVVVNHFKSKGGCNDADEANTDQGDGQACYNAVRVDSAQALADWLASDTDGVGADATLILGDLNAYRREDPIRALTQAGYRDLLAVADDPGLPPPHSFVFQGQAGLLDHALAGKALVDRVVGAGVWSINADELPEFAYDGDSRSGRRLYSADPWRSSDHDPVWVDLNP
jgi:predicted extracellular nuclease